MTSNLVKNLSKISECQDFEKYDDIKPLVLKPSCWISSLKNLAIKEPYDLKYFMDTLFKYVKALNLKIVVDGKNISSILCNLEDDKKVFLRELCTKLLFASVPSYKNFEALLKENGIIEEEN